VKRDLERIEIPGEHDARERAWSVLQAAFAHREPVRPPTRRLRPVVALSSPGRAVIDELREAVGVERAQPALFALPAEGRLLVSSDEGVWVVQQDGSRRLLDGYREGSWSPLGRYIVAAKQNELAALEADGDIRWALSRPRVRFPRWTGSESDTRIAYLASGGLHVVAGDGSGDTDLTDLHATVQLAPAWRPGTGFELAYVDWRGRVHTLDLRTSRPRRTFFSGRFPEARKLVWSSDGDRLLLVTPFKLLVFGTESPSPLVVRQMRGIVDAAFEPGTHRVAVSRRNEVVVVDVDRRAAAPRRLFTLGGPLVGLAWSPDGRWLATGWPAADQWVFMRADGKRIRAVSNVSSQFRSRGFPRIDGWCCPPE
jgi:hypothetical protein